jgi:hypothetical protein
MRYGSDVALKGAALNEVPAQRARYAEGAVSCSRCVS